jgi:competence protein ComEA
MSLQELKDGYWELIKPHLLPLSLGCIGLILIVYGVISLFSSSKQDSGIVFEAAAQEEVSIYVDVAGAVIKPGVYKLSNSSRMQDALIAAGGLSADADRKWVSKTINLARKVEDGAKIYIPTKGEIVTAGIVGSATTTTTTGVAGDSITGKININVATQAQLEALPGVGPVTAQKIIGNRPYSSIEDLKSKKAVSNNVFEKIKDSIEAY